MVDQTEAPVAPTELGPEVRFLLDTLPMARKTTIVDVGANPIITPDYIHLLRNGHARVVGFEPQAEAFARLEAEKGADELYFPHAVGRGGPASLHIFYAEGMTSTFAPDPASIQLVFGARGAMVRETIGFDTLALDALTDLPEFDLLKIDIQGGEVAVFEGGARVLGQAVAVMVELRYLRLYQGEPMLGGVDSALRNLGFSLHKFMPNKAKALRNSQMARLNPRRNRDQLIDGDGVYIRDLTTLDSWRDEQIVHLAILAAEVFKSHSLVLHLLDALVQRGVVGAEVPGRYVDHLPAQFLARSPS